MTQLLVVTHTESQHHLEGVVGGWYDSELSARGHHQASQVASAVRALIPAGAPVTLHTSDLLRARQTAAPIAAVLAVDAVPMSDLRERSYGVAGGRPEAWLRERYTSAPDHDRLDHDPGVDGAETRRQLVERVYRAVEGVLSKPEDHHVVVTHGGVLTYVITAWAQIPVEAVGWINVRATPGGMTSLVEDQRFGNRSVAFVNRTDHLSSAAS